MPLFTSPQATKNSKIDVEQRCAKQMVCEEMTTTLKRVTKQMPTFYVLCKHPNFKIREIYTECKKYSVSSHYDFVKHSYTKQEFADKFERFADMTAHFGHTVLTYWEIHGEYHGIYISAYGKLGYTIIDDPVRRDFVEYRYDLNGERLMEQFLAEVTAGINAIQNMYSYLDNVENEEFTHTNIIIDDSAKAAANQDFKLSILKLQQKRMFGVPISDEEKQTVQDLFLKCTFLIPVHEMEDGQTYLEHSALFGHDVGGITVPSVIDNSGWCLMVPVFTDLNSLRELYPNKYWNVRAFTIKELVEISKANSREFVINPGTIGYAFSTQSIIELSEE